MDIYIIDSLYNPNLPNADTKLAGWTFYTVAAGSVELSIWRPTGLTNTFTLVTQEINVHIALQR